MIEDETGPCPPFSVITLDNQTFDKKHLRYSQLATGIVVPNDFVRLFRTIIITCSHAIKNTDHITNNLKEDDWKNLP
jgi:hypothetical protein